VDAFIISFAQDTNGQNARFVRAAEKYGVDVIRSFAIGSDDPAGVVARLQAAANKGEALRIRSAHRVTHYFEFPNDIVWTPMTEPFIKELLRKADVVHLNNSFRAVSRFHINKPMLLHHHGSMFRNNAVNMLGVAKHHKMAQAVSTVDLMKPDPEILRWLPSAYDIDELQRIGKANRREPDGRIRIVHAPTNRALKHTDLFLSIVDSLKEKYPIDVVIVEGKTNAETLIEKAKADIVYDQIAFGYGCNGIEAWGLGVPVIAGGEPWTLHKMREMWGTLPFAEADERSLATVTEDLIASASMRAEYAERGLAHVRKYHDEQPALQVLLELYHEAMTRHHRPRIQGKGVMFQYANKRPHVVTDVQEVARLRVQAKRRPEFVKEIEDEAV
jgi:glycosyltransferase involved in cell wall biosynthesis